MVQLDEGKLKRLSQQALKEQWKKISSLDTQLVNILQRIKLGTLKAQII